MHYRQKKLDAPGLNLRLVEGAGQSESWRDLDHQNTPVWLINTHIFQMGQLMNSHDRDSSARRPAMKFQPTATVPIILPNGGKFKKQAIVALRSVTDGAAIRYTLDGATPGRGARLYAGPLTLMQSATLKAQAFKSGYKDSEVIIVNFIITGNRFAGWWQKFVGLFKR